MMKEKMLKKSVVNVDDIVKEISASFDYEFNGESVFAPPKMDVPTNDFCIGLIVGPSGSGKSTLLESFNVEEKIDWVETMAVCSHFGSAVNAQDKLAAVGLNSIPSWMRPYHVLSTGEKFRADLARRIKDGAVIDEFTSVVDRNVAKSCANAMSRYCRSHGVQRMVFASCHYDIIEWLQPDWVFDTSIGKFAERGLERRPEIKLDIEPCTKEAWAIFKDHHYLSKAINKSARAWLATWNGVPIGFASALAFPSGSIKNAWREHRTVVLPDYQGLGIGVRISDAVASMFVDHGCRYFSKTSHPRMGEYREASSLWRPTSKNKMMRKDYSESRKTKEDKHKMLHANRLCYSHEFVGGRLRS